MYDGEKVRVVGYGPEHVIISTQKGGWEFGIIHNVNRLLLHDGEKGLYVDIEELMPIETQEIDLCEILKGCEGVELWSDIFGKCKFVESLSGDSDYEIVVLVLDTNSGDNEYEQFTKYGRFYDCYPSGKCMLWPSETNRDWSTFKKPIKIKEGDPVMCFNGICNSWVLRKYNNAVPVYYKHIVPATEFDFTNIESNKSKSII